MGNLLFYPAARPQTKAPNSVPLGRAVQRSRVLIEFAHRYLTRNRVLLTILLERRSTTRQVLDSSNERLRLSAALLFEEWRTLNRRSAATKPPERV